MTSMNWKTSVAGLIAAIVPWIGTAFPQYDGIAKAIGSVALAVFAYFAKDKA